MNRKTKRDLIYCIHLNVIDNKTGTDTRKSVQQPIYQSKGSDGRSSELCY